MFMVNLQSAENALKSYYLDAIKDSLDQKTSPFLAKIEHSTADVYGKDVKKMIRLGFNGGVMAGTETGDLPKADGTNYLQMTATLKNLYGTIEISDKAIRAAMSNEGAFVNLLNEEMTHLLNGAKYNFNRMLMGEGKGSLAFYMSPEGNSMFVNNVSKLQVGMYVRLCDDSYDPVEPDDVVRKITNVDKSASSVTVSGPAFASDIVNDGYLVVASQEDELTGLKALFEKNSVYGLTEEEYAKVKPYEINIDADFDELSLQTLIDNIEEETNATPNLIICSYGVRRAILNYYKEKGVTMDSHEIEGGFTALNFNGIPIVADRFCDKGVLYVINTNDFKLCQLCDWQWMENEDGKILHQVPGKPVYTATLVKYAELLCERPQGQGRMIGIYEA